MAHQYKQKEIQQKKKTDKIIEWKNFQRKNPYSRKQN
jgi:hypothetical protein